MDFEEFNDAYTERLRAGDRETEAHFVRYFGELLELKLRSRVRSRDIVEDLKQETFVRVLRLIRSKEGIRDAGRLGPLVNAVCNHVLSEQYRSGKRVEPLEPEVADHLPSAAPSALSRMIVQDQQNAVHRVLNELSPRDRKMLRAVFLDEADRDEVCREFEVDRQYLRVLLHRAKNSFRVVYQKHQEGMQPRQRDGGMEQKF